MDCGNNPCDFAVDLRGQRTSGRCRCWDSLPKMEPEQRVALRRTVAELRSRIAALEAQLADRDAEIVDLRERLDAESSQRISLCSDSERFLAEIERLRTARDDMEKRAIALGKDVIKLDDSRLKTLRDADAEIERLRADLVWASKCVVRWDSDGFIYHTREHPFSHRDSKWLRHDGTPESICRAVREARDGVR